ncbi:hypothetical protein IWQ60_007607 [Tieghemiomyces parasiticus]|uniref:Uncharacterized protein n=1 Tax=Tieghemiomyces parasiticus TaxID=78921 RepID=A0A9W8A4G8_9FUNG|nr:hypothetical protein IWQ60_007607 [Tieghemiomyces parasiticus]
MVTTRSGKRTDQRSLSNPIRRRAPPLTYVRSNAIIQALVDLEIWRTQLLSKQLPAEVRKKLSPSVNSVVSDSQITSVYYAARRLVTARQTSAGPWARVPNSKKQVPTDAELTEQAALLNTWHTHLHPPSPAESSGIANVSNFPAVANPTYSPHEQSPTYDAINVGPVSFSSSVTRLHSKQTTVLSDGHQNFGPMGRRRLL